MIISGVYCIFLNNLVIKIDDLGDWRKTHYSNEISPKLEGKEVTVFGWVSSIRKQGGLVFIIIQDKEGIVQVTAHRDKIPRQVMSKIEKLVEQSTLAVRGLVESIAKAPHGAEIIPRDLKILSIPQLQIPYSLFGGDLPSIDKRLDIRAIDLRRAKAQALLKIRRVVVASIRQFFGERGYAEVNTPKIIATATEGGAALFPLLYYDKEAFLTQSPQLYKEQLVMSLEKVFEIGPAFRAEESRTLLHLSEFTSVDVEEAYVDYNDIMGTIEGMTKYVVSNIVDACKDEITLLKLDFDYTSKPFGRYTYDEILERLRKVDVKIEWGEDLNTDSLQKLGKELQGFYFITDWPSAPKPFYIRPKTNREDVSESFDFMHGSVELASGGTRVSSKKLLVKRLKERGLNPKGFEYHLRVFDYGMPPHAGFGLGLERFLARLTNQDNVREVALFPRDQFRLTP